ncbi:hypothetical protein CPLU01_14142 [Colletotrichum plurivorum]|uniref:Uncharacterized protein n=1 Tax=Colletotrichum plurivorum TaxID=2175906 RepID=A0A8H6JML1_9PEZI|nr:hypothetical protein CPLU01_14142 [Colletotrichum plurivorum]
MQADRGLVWSLMRRRRRRRRQQQGAAATRGPHVVGFPRPGDWRLDPRSRAWRANEVVTGAAGNEERVE